MKILVIDDDRAMRQVVRCTLELDGHEVLTAVTVAEGLELALEQQPDAILLDSVLPGVDGLAGLAAIRENTRTQAIPVISFSSRSDPNDITKARQAGAAGYITKPFDPDGLAAAIVDILSGAAGSGDELPPAGGKDTEESVADRGSVLAAIQALIPDLETRKARYTVNAGAMDTELLALFADQAREHVEAINTAFACGDAETVKLRAHSVKGIGGTMGAPEISVLAEEMEGLTDISDPGRPAQLLATMLSWERTLPHPEAAM